MSLTFKFEWRSVLRPVGLTRPLIEAELVVGSRYIMTLQVVDLFVDRGRLHRMHSGGRSQQFRVDCIHTEP